MPASNELVSNRPLSGTELREIMLKDLANMLDKDGMFAPHIGYARAAYRITVKLHVDNPMYPEHNVSVQSKAPARNTKDEARKMLEPPPLAKPGEEAVVAAATRERTIESPNGARLEHNLPITVLKKDGNTGEMKEKAVTYTNAEGRTGGPPPVDKDISDNVDWSE